MVYKEGSEESGGGDPLPKWLDNSCVYRVICQCNLVGGWSWHHLGALCSNILSRQHQVFGRNCGCSQDQWYYPHGCDQNTMNTAIAVKLVRVVIEVLRDVPPVVPP